MWRSKACRLATTRFNSLVIGEGTTTSASHASSYSPHQRPSTSPSHAFIMRAFGRNILRRKQNQDNRRGGRLGVQSESWLFYSPCFPLPFHTIKTLSFFFSLSLTLEASVDVRYFLRKAGKSLPTTW